MRRIVAVLGVVSLAACGEGGGPTGSGQVASVRMAATSISLFAGQTEQLGATAIDAAGNPVASAGSPVWRTSNPSVVSVTPAGVVTALSVGTVDVTAAFGSVSGVTRVTVSQPPFTALVSMPALSFAPFSVFIRATGTVTYEFPQLEHNVIFRPRVGVPADIQRVSNARVTRRFDAAGVFAYDCALHPGMAGEVHVFP